jgi:hypothetical protein
MNEVRRQHERYEIELPVMVVLGADEVPGATVNVSLGGMLLRLSKPVPFGASLVLRVQLPSSKEMSEMDAVVRWEKDGAVGVQFSSLRARDTWALNQLLKAK